MGQFPHEEVVSTKEAPPSKIEAGPLSGPGITSTGIMFLIAVLAGALSYYHKLRKGHQFSIMNFTMELVTSGVVGVTFYWIFRGLGVNEYLAAAGCAVAGHSGSRAWYLAANVFERWLKALKP